MSETVPYSTELSADGTLTLRMFQTLEMFNHGEDRDRISWICVREGQHLTESDALLELEGLKLGVEIFPPWPCIVEQILVSSGQHVSIGEPLLILRPTRRPLDRVTASASSAEYPFASEDPTP